LVINSGHIAEGAAALASIDHGGTGRDRRETAAAVIRAGVIYNPRSRRNRGAEPPRALQGVQVEAPRGGRALDDTLARFAASGIDLLVVDGGDGTVREVLTRAPGHFKAGVPRLAILPSGKTNALAFDLGAPRDWSIEAALASAEANHVSTRRPIEILRKGAETPLVRGFIFGAGAFVRATDLAQRTHKLGAFEGVAVGLTLGAAAVKTLFGGSRSGWRAGEPMSLRFDDEPAHAGDIFLLMASTLKRLPLGAKPFDPSPPGGLRSLTVEAPPKRLVSALSRLLAGANAPWLAKAGYHRRALERLDVTLDTSFVLDGETYPGGAFSLRAGAVLEFVRP